MEKEIISAEEIEDLLTFIVPRNNIPPDIETRIVEQKKDGFREQLKECVIYKHLLPELKITLEKQYMDSMITPGECVGIIGAQSMGEYSTQATLNTFHVAGADTGSTSGVLRFQDLINASKTIKVDTISLFFQPKYENLPLSTLRIKVSSLITEVKLTDLVLDYEILAPGNWGETNLLLNVTKTLFPFYTQETAAKCLRLKLCKRTLLKHRLYPSVIKTKIEVKKDALCVFEPLSYSDSHFLFFYVFLDEEEDVSEFSVQQFLEMKICGIDGISRFDFKKLTCGTPSGDKWYIETRGGTIEQTNCLSNIFDTTKTKTTSVWDIYNTFGIEATKRFLVQELKKVMDGVDICHIKLLVERMTYSGTIEPITRYTMRNDKGPLHRASFEESFETFMKAGKYQEIEPFKGVSASVIGGKKAAVGTYMCDIFLDLNKIMSFNSQTAFLVAIEEEDDLVYE